MTNHRPGVSRRQFLGSVLSLSAMGLPLGTRLASGSQTVFTGRNGRSRVVLVRDREAVDDTGKIQGDVVSAMIDQAIVALVGVETPQQAWNSLLTPSDTVGIKSNAWRFLPTPPEVEEALRRRVLGAGVAPERISIDDRGVLANHIFQEASALINVRPMRTHHWAGVGSCLKNYIMFDENPSRWHDDSCADLAGLWSKPLVRGKTRLNVLVLLTPLFHGKGPHHFNARYTWPYRGILVGTDPVAVDATGLRILQARRREFFGRGEPLAVSPKHIRLAETRHGLGIADPARVDVVRLGWQEGVLI